MTDQALRNAAADGAAGDLAGAWFALHDGDTDNDQVSNQRLQPDYDSAAGSVAALSGPLEFTGDPQQTVTHLGVWDAETDGELRFTRPLSGDLAFNVAGELRLVAASVTVDDAS